MTKLSPQHKWILAIIGVVLVNVAIWMYGLSPAMEKVEVAQDQLRRRQEESARLEQRLEQLNSIDTDALEEAIAGYNVLIPEKGMLREFITELERMAEVRGLSFNRITISEPSLQDQFLATFISIGIEGSYSSLINYVTSLEEHQRLLFVETFRLTGRSDTTVDSTIDLVIFAEDFDEITPHAASGRNNPFR